MFGALLLGLPFALLLIFVLGWHRPLAGDLRPFMRADVARHPHLDSVKVDRALEAAYDHVSRGWRKFAWQAPAALTFFVGMPLVTWWVRRENPSGPGDNLSYLIALMVISFAVSWITARARRRAMSRLFQALLARNGA